LRNTHLTGDELNLLFNNFCNFINGNGLNNELLNEELLDNLNSTIEKYEKESFLIWNYH
jgi:hypothetical protein